MNTTDGKSLSACLFSATILAALLSVPTVSRAQTGNTATGTNALFHNTTGNYNTANGFDTLFSNTTGGNNTANGYEALYINTTGLYNTANGYQALYSNTTGQFNTANGMLALFNNTTGFYNTANGNDALFNNTTGQYNIANGYQALYSNTTGQYNSANGVGALYSNTVGAQNTANGDTALYSNVSGQYNTANGVGALYSNTGSYNTANGVNALYYNTTGQFNTATGVGAINANVTGINNTADGFYALLNVSGSNNTALGYGAGVNLFGSSNNIDIGNQGVTGDNNVIRIGTDGTHFSTYISGVAAVGITGSTVYITPSGQLGILRSSARFKYDIHDMGARSDKLMDLRPVLFRYKEATEEGTHPVQYGLIAEEVAKVYPDLVQYDKQGKPFTVYYHLLTPMMLNELQKAHQQLATQQTEINSLKATVQNQSAGTTSLQNMVQTLLLVVTALVLAALAGGAYLLAGKTKRIPSPRTRVRPIENSAS